MISTEIYFFIFLISFRSIKLSFNDRMDRVSAVRKLLPDIEKTAEEFKMTPRKITTVMNKLPLGKYKSMKHKY